MSELPNNWDPKPSERSYYRSPVDNQRGYLVRRGGKDMIRLDRPMEEILYPVEGWKSDRGAPAVNPNQLGYVTWAADQALCRVLGVAAGTKEWIGLKEQERIKWMEEGPGDGGRRDDLFDAISGTLQGMKDG